MNVLGLDIGGANIKAAWGAIGAKGEVRDIKVKLLPFALWRSPGMLTEKLREVAASLGVVDALAVTMTGELCDCFATRREGVLHILELVGRFKGEVPVQVWSTREGFFSAQAARENWIDVASANWHVLASHLARTHREGVSLVIDTGSTTTDIIRLEHGEVRAIGMTDADRLKTGELVYTGVSRTPLATIMNEWIGTGGQCHRVAAEAFATTLDIYTLLGDLPEDAGNLDTPDARPMTKQNAANRILRMVGTDLSRDTMEDAQMWAGRFAQKQVGMISSAITGCIGDAEQVRVIVCGSGAFLAERAARNALEGRMELIQLSDALGEAASAAACAVALVCLWSETNVGMPSQCEGSKDE